MCFYIQMSLFSFYFKKYLYWEHHCVCVCVCVFVCVCHLSCFQLFSRVWLHRLYSTRLLCPWDSPGKNTGVGCYFLLQVTPLWVNSYYFLAHISQKISPCLLFSGCYWENSFISLKLFSLSSLVAFNMPLPFYMQRMNIEMSMVCISFCLYYLELIA